ncbi:MAG: divalent-cation tolerance protein CutA [Desulfobacteraceae bacterium]|jgi:periplasmic divalent cation tolerance protein|nr:divalent-cation tolerance protein CutA [Desulfobacteraceae bacterium]
MENTSLVYMTVGSKAEAMAIGNELVSHRLAACVNIIDQMNSIYRWDGDVQIDSEVVMIAKTTTSNVPELIEIVKANHSYECPCIVSVHITGGNPEFLNWIAAEVKK